MDIQIITSNMFRKQDVRAFSDIFYHLFTSFIVQKEPLHSEGGARLTITPEPGYTVACGFDSPDSVDWGETLWVWSEKR